MVAFFVNDATNQKEQQRISGTQRMNTQRRNDVVDGNGTKIINKDVDGVAEKEFSIFRRQNGNRIKDGGYIV